MVRATEVLSERYEVAELLGVGGMGNVYRARDRVLHRDVAVKVLKDELSSDSPTLQRFTREARIAASLSHPAIASVFDFAEDGGRHFIVMEYLRGSDLHKHLASRGALEAAEALQIAAAVADGLHHAHQLGAVHRDIKPANIFLTDNAGVKVTDFGIATAAAQAPLTATGDVLGTPHYLSPEQVQGEQATAASDIYALGCVLFEMVTGRRPFEAESSMAIAMAHGSRPAPSARALVASLPEEVDRLIAKAMSKQPQQRFSSAAEMAAEARAAIPKVSLLPDVPADATGTTTGVIGAGGPPTVIEASAPQGPTWLSHRPRLVAGALLAAMAGVILLAQLCGPAAPAAVQVPQLVAMSFEDASARLDKMGLKLRRGMVALSNQPAGHVYAQRPTAGTRVPRESAVMLFVSSGKGSRAPNVAGLTVDQAAAALRGAQLKGTIVSRVPGTAADVIVSQDPPAGTLLKAGSSIALVVTEVPAEADPEDEPKEDDERKGRGKGKGDED